MQPTGSVGETLTAGGPRTSMRAVSGGGTALIESMRISFELALPAVIP